MQNILHSKYLEDKIKLIKNEKQLKDMTFTKPKSKLMLKKNTKNSDYDSRFLRFRGDASVN